MERILYSYPAGDSIAGPTSSILGGVSFCPKFRGGRTTFRYRRMCRRSMSSWSRCWRSGFRWRPAGTPGSGRRAQLFGGASGALLAGVKPSATLPIPACAGTPRDENRGTVFAGFSMASRDHGWLPVCRERGTSPSPSRVYDRATFPIPTPPGFRPSPADAATSGDSRIAPTGMWAILRSACLPLTGN